MKRRSLIIFAIAIIIIFIIVDLVYMQTQTSKEIAKSWHYTLSARYDDTGDTTSGLAEVVILSPTASSSSIKITIKDIPQDPLHAANNFFINNNDSVTLELQRRPNADNNWTISTQSPISQYAYAAVETNESGDATKITLTYSNDKVSEEYNFTPAQ